MKIRAHRLVDVAFQKTPNQSPGLTPEGIILHDTAGRLETKGSVDWLCNPAAKASAHLVVGRDGDVVQLADFNKKTWHAGRSSYRGRSGCNNFTIGIEIVNPGKMTLSAKGGKAWYGQIFDDEEYNLELMETPEHGEGVWMPYTEAQLTAVTDICVALVNHYQLGFITTHWDISPGRKVDTNPLFPLQNVRGRAFGRVTTADDGPDGRTRVALNVRRWPAITSQIMATLDRGSGFDIVRSGEFDGARWHLVRAPEGETPWAFGEGWVHGGYVDLN